MAARKKRALTPEEQLDAALVPESEWPYEVPGNWCWTRLGNVAQYINGRAFKPTEWEDEGRVIIRIQNLTQSTTIVNRTTKTYEEKYLVRSGDLLFAWSASLGAHFWNGEDGWLNQHIFKVIPHEGVDKLYLYFYLVNVVDQLYAKTHGSGMVHITMKPFKATSMPLPPLHEQRRIASRIEWLFAKLDEAEAELREVIDSSGQRQAAILHRAFNGELSESWRATHNVNQNTWSVKRFDEVAYIRSNLVDPATFSEYPHIAPDNIEKKTGVLLPYRTIGEDGVTSGKHHFYPGQILYSKIRPYLSKAVVVDFEGLCSADMYPIETIEDTRYLWYYILSEDFLEQTYSAGSRTVLPKINQKGLSAIKVPIPTKAEQRFISDALDTYFESSRQAESQVMEALQQIQSLRQTILAKAQHGRLGTNDPDEPSSKELLASIMSGNADK